MYCNGIQQQSLSLMDVYVSTNWMLSLLLENLLLFCNFGIQGEYGKLNNDVVKLYCCIITKGSLGWEGELQMGNQTIGPYSIGYACIWWILGLPSFPSFHNSSHAGLYATYGQNLQLSLHILKSDLKELHCRLIYKIALHQLFSRQCSSPVDRQADLEVHCQHMACDQYCL